MEVQKKEKKIKIDLKNKRHQENIKRRLINGDKRKWHCNKK